MTDSSCQLSIEWDQSDRVFRPEDVAKGTLRIDATSDYYCRRVTVAHGWLGGWDEIRGKEPWHDRREEIVLEESTLPADTHTYPFQFIAPAEPPSYVGRRLKIRWCVEATVEVDDGTPVRIIKDFQLAASSQPGNVGCVRSTKPTTPFTERRIEAFGYMFFAFCLLGLALMLAVFGGWLLFQPEQQPWNLLLLTMPVLVYAAYRCFRRGRSILLADWRLGTVQVQTPKTARRGETIDAILLIQPRDTVHVKRLTISLMSQESYAEPPDYDYPERYTRYEKAKTLIDSETLLPAGEEQQWNAEFVVPVDAPLPFTYDAWRVSWGVAFRLQLADGHEWEAGENLCIESQ